MLSRDDPRHIFNARQQGGGVRVINAFDGTDFLEQALKTKQGEEMFLNFLRTTTRARSDPP